MKKPKLQNETMVAITEKEYKRLLESERKLECLECCGVDNWSGYGDAIEMYHEEEED